MADGSRKADSRPSQPGERRALQLRKGPASASQHESHAAIRRDAQYRRSNQAPNGGRRRSSTTADHTHFAGFLASPLRRGRFFTYLMWRPDRGFRVGLAAGAYSIGHSTHCRFGPAHRGLIERADAVWIVSVHDREIVTPGSPRQRSPPRYGLPTMPFVAVAGRNREDEHRVQPATHRPAVHRLPNESREVIASSRKSGLAFELPHYQPQARTMLSRYGESRRVVNVGLCAARSGATVLHRVAVSGSDQEGRDTLEQLGLNSATRSRVKHTAGCSTTMRRNLRRGPRARRDDQPAGSRCVLRQVAAIGDAEVPGRPRDEPPLRTGTSTYAQGWSWRPRTACWSESKTLTS